MKLIINEFGSYLSKKENRFVIKNKEKKEEYSADDVNQILITSPSSLTEGAVKLAIERNIDIVFTTYSGRPFARIYPCTLGGTTLTRREQAKAYYNEKGKIIVKRIIEAKLYNQLSLIKRLNKTRNDLFAKEISLLEENTEKLKKYQISDLEKSKEVILGYEGYGASVYFSCLNKIINISKRDPESNDIGNITLNYGYGILYSEVERACILSGLDPYLGFLHSDRYGKPSMVLDLLEQFRPIIDKSIINLFVQKQLSDIDLEKIGDATLLTKNGRTKIIEAVQKGLAKRAKFKNKYLKVSNIILEQGREITRFLLEDSNDLIPFLWRE
nr:CRISPR-associated endonuclease Cas1 [uncultured archaeon]